MLKRRTKSRDDIGQQVVVKMKRHMSLFFTGSIQADLRSVLIRLHIEAARTAK